MESEITTHATTTGVLLGPGARLIRPREGHQLRIIEEPIPMGIDPIDRTLGRPSRDGITT